MWVRTSIISWTASSAVARSSAPQSARDLGGVRRAERALRRREPRRERDRGELEARQGGLLRDRQCPGRHGRERRTRSREDQDQDDEADIGGLRGEARPVPELRPEGVPPAADLHLEGQRAAQHLGDEVRVRRDLGETRQIAGEREK